MQTRINYSLVGLFIIGLLVALVSITSWLLASNNGKHYKLYAAYLDESVSGLSKEASVKFNGVDVGNVGSIEVNPSNPQQVQVLLQIQQGVPIAESTTATMVTQGLTGIRYINLTPGKFHDKLLHKKPGQRYPVIKTEPSLFIRLDMAVSELIDDFHKLTENLQTVVNDNNRRSIEKSLTNIAKSSEYFSQVMQSMIATADTIKKTSEKLEQTADEANISIQQALPTTINTLDELELTAKRMQTFFDKLNDNPSILVRGQQQIAAGPVE